MQQRETSAAEEAVEPVTCIVSPTVGVANIRESSNFWSG